jgi:hypothetical protein
MYYSINIKAYELFLFQQKKVLLYFYFMFVVYNLLIFIGTMLLA